MSSVSPSSFNLKYLALVVPTGLLLSYLISDGMMITRRLMSEAAALLLAPSTDLLPSATLKLNLPPPDDHTPRDHRLHFIGSYVLPRPCHHASCIMLCSLLGAYIPYTHTPPPTPLNTLLHTLAVVREYIRTSSVRTVHPSSHLSIYLPTWHPQSTQPNQSTCTRSPIFQ